MKLDCNINCPGTWLIVSISALFLAAPVIHAQNQPISTKTVAVSVPLDTNWSSSNGQEFPGATVKFAVVPSGYKAGSPSVQLTGDFTGGGAYCCAGRTFNDLDLQVVKDLTMEVKSSDVSNISVRVVDSTGQTHQAKNIVVNSDGTWHEMTLDPASLAGGEHWGGANDGKWHGPISQFYLLVGPASGPTKIPVISLADINLDVPAPVAATVVHAEVNSAAPRGAPSPITAKRAADFLNSIGADSAIDSRGETLANTIKCAQYVGIRWFRAGIEGNMPVQDFETAYKQAGIRFDWCIGSAGSDVDKLLSTARQIETATPGAILSFEGPNEPNNWGITFQGQKGGDGNGTWLPVAKLQNAIYTGVKSDPVLKNKMVWGISENGAETDNVGLQFLTIPAGAGSLMPDGTKFADYANVHNYIYHQNSPHVEDNKTWNASDPTQACKVDGLYGEYGSTWAKHFAGYTTAQLLTLPRVTTETGTTIGDEVTEEIHGLNLLSMYLDQFKRGWSYTAVYLLRDRVDEGGNQQFGFYKPSYAPRPAAVYLHNLTTILSDGGAPAKTGDLMYVVVNEPTTVHDMLLQKSDGRYELLVWDEKVTGSDSVDVNLGRTVKSLKVYDPTVGIDPVQTLANVKSVKLTLTDHAGILEIPSVPLD